MITSLTQDLDDHFVKDLDDDIGYLDDSLLGDDPFVKDLMQLDPWIDVNSQFERYCSLAVLTNNFHLNLPIVGIVKQIYPELLKSKRVAKNKRISTILKHCCVFNQRLKSRPSKVLSHVTLKARQAVFHPSPPMPLFPNIKNLYSHQAAALLALKRGSNIIITTSTSSGKSLVYQLPIAESLASASTCSILLFPTIALCNDQKRAFDSIISHDSVFALDSSVSSSIRRDMRSSARVLFTNPDMIHVSILPHHHLWRRVLLNLKYLVIDELHYYSGQFGTHFSFIIKRLLRLACFYGNDAVQIVACSATISNPITVFFL
jgi:superfamily II RNA helicase